MTDAINTVIVLYCIHSDVGRLMILYNLKQDCKSNRLILLSIFFPGNIKKLLVWIKENLLKERPELFIQGDNV